MKRLISIALCLTTPLFSCRQTLSETVNGHPEVMEAYDSLIHSLDASLVIKPTQREKILAALDFAALKHRGQTRKGSSLPSIYHPIVVAQQILNSGQAYHQPNVIMAALLHDTVEKTKTTFEEIGEQFGLRVESYVREVTDDPALPKLTRKIKQIETAPHKSTGAAVIRLSDKLNNLHEITLSPPEGWSQDQIDQHFRWVEAVVRRLPPVNPTLRRDLEEALAGHWAVPRQQ
jgi:(p)ppGpp synthase/HD superfamily hydrolase